MTERSQIKPQTNILSSYDSGAGPPLNNLHHSRLDPQNSIEDYNRTMLEYTHRQMSTFVDNDEGRAIGNTSSRSSQSSGNSGASGNGVFPRHANGSPPTSASSSADPRHAAQQLRHKTPRAANERSF